MAQCKAIRKDGQRCRARARKGSDYCVWHDPASEEDTTHDERILHITVVNHTPATNQTKEKSYINLRLPASSAGVAFDMLPRHRWGGLNPRTMLSIVESGIVGEVLRMRQKAFSICIRVELAH